MCNPRRVRVRATRTISEQWRAEINRTAHAQGTVAGEARLVRSLRTMLARPALAAFRHAVVQDPLWTEHGGEYHYAVTDGIVIYRPEADELEISVRLTADVTVEGVARHVVTGEVTDDIEAEREGTYYADNFAGRTRQVAEREAQTGVDAAVEEMARQRRQDLVREAGALAQDAMATRADEVQEAARADAARRLVEESRLHEDQLRVTAQQRLDEIHETTLNGLLRTMVTGYRNAITEFARTRNAQNLVVREQDGVVEIQFEIEA